MYLCIYRSPIFLKEWYFENPEVQLAKEMVLLLVRPASTKCGSHGQENELSSIWYSEHVEVP